MDRQAPFRAKPDTDYNMTLLVNGLVASLAVNNATAFSSTFPPTSVDGSGHPVANSFDYLPLAPSVVFRNPLTNNGATGPFPAEMTRRNAFRGPGYWNMDAGLYKRVRFNEKYSLQLRFEAFNVFNHSNLFVDVNNLDASGTNAVTALRGVFPSGNLERRNVQLAAKFIF